MKNTTRKLAISAAVGAAYAVATMLTAPISYGPLQLRISEVLNVFPFFLPFTSWGLFVGCMIANLISSGGLLDIVFGSLATMLAALCMAVIGRGGDRTSWLRCIFACAMPVLWNGITVGAVLALSTSTSILLFGAMFAVCSLEVAAGEAVVMFCLALPLMRYLPKNRAFAALMDED